MEAQTTSTQQPRHTRLYRSRTSNRSEHRSSHVRSRTRHERIASHGETPNGSTDKASKRRRRSGLDNDTVVTDAATFSASDVAPWAYQSQELLGGNGTDPRVDVDIPFVANNETAYPDPSSAGAVHEYPYFGSFLTLMHPAPYTISSCSMPPGKSHYAEDESHRPVERIGTTPRTETTVDGELNTDGQVMATVDVLPSAVTGGVTHVGMPQAASCLTAYSEPAGGALSGGGISSDAQSLPVSVSTPQDRQDTEQLIHVGRTRQPNRCITDDEWIKIRQFAVSNPRSSYGKIGKKFDLRKETIGRILKEKKRPLEGDIPTDAIKKAPKRLSDNVKAQMCLYHQKNPNITQKDIGKKFGVNQSTVSLILRVQGKAAVSEVNGHPS
ncbi:CENP-B N-terminal DNA-binding domain [Apiospora rasikravindrae]|uniref:CENP-B N-terminal DNA-binding domain n=1 Tax=Apiospora rasikravindrae TaxID=990691 RepID=A0ABR1SZ96_9PEZI